MKKLGKLSINPDRLMKNEELVNLRGGYGGYGTPCPSGKREYMCICNPGMGAWTGCYTSQSDAEQDLGEYCSGGTGACAATGN